MQKRAALLLVGTLLVSFGQQAAAEEVADFYRGKQIQMIVSTGAGTVFDTYARLLARYMIKYIPGKPTTVVTMNMPGAGGIRAMNYLGHNAPKDGTVLAITNQGLPLYQAIQLGNGLRVDLRNMNWIGNLSASNQVLATWHKSKTKTLEDARERETTVGVAGAGSITSQLPALYNNVLHTKLKLVAGYIAGTDINLAMERGELEGRGSNTWSSYVSLNPDWIREKKINVIIQVGMKKEATLPHVPLLIDQAKNEQDRAVFSLMSRVAAISRPIVTTPGVPAERIKALRAAFDQTIRDPAFLEEARRQRLEIDAVDGEQLQKMMSDIIDAPQATKEKVREAIEAPAASAER